MRKIFLFILLVGGVFTLAGCATNKGKKNLDNFGKLQKSGNFSTSAPFKIDLPKGSVDNLIVGQKVLVMSTAGQDGILNANRIMAGEGDPGVFFGNGRYFASSSTGTAFSAGQRANSDLSGNIPRGSVGGGNRANKGQRTVDKQGASNVRGEIIKKDTTSLVIKTDDGGSKIVYYSDKTEIFLLPDSKPEDAKK
ncbi:MAG: hypothetical protein UT86_C0005G0020 [Candidatus Magasanikbacteria bacterium GW2011_GWC2_40_17]|uniref:DUF5666 domain-containing protein n=1 Tax=Candidatus Magasanikbacteria bacterium GW2011_GWA2_42_32 TaxID=1619039 RepID=A0A0G1CDI2_9BACT|nr:MAG: hypothetical protein UT86_C0005G0020 [Candidatus Magasanikbacteria bacterium GW2011_GWC2_40_17]KKS56756.1 MAG: hypothetical protein UV20_C0006G0039 [Candidatus Magasanikbacteria bacterium GW2011_GWA2_42_32]OGH86055.1 MAG: hypothetical protein A2294_02220 [Candidatus Magasanikbacteria bacterium RIFOXYB2_FULL_38_10]